MVKIFIDPGHGGTDPGAVGNGLQEKNLTLTISQKIRNLLTDYENTQVTLSRENDQYLSLKQRTDTANAWGADFLLSVHINAGGGTGYEDFCHDKLAASSPIDRIQDAIHTAVMAEIKGYGVKDRGAKSANFHMLRESKMPAVLAENLFIDTATDANLLKQASFIDAVARGHVNGLAKAFNLKKKTVSNPETSPNKPATDGYTHTIVKGDTLWSLSQKYGTTVANLKKLNPDINENALRVGSKLIVTTGATYHTVQKGDTVSGLAERYGSTITLIKDWNNLNAQYLIRVGQKLRVK
ncbi:N-acetylmuramoyl-L-alanine amidase [Brevibacterium sp. JNUCC-42]|nr:N-acetylmuramoyl-L-alanine amidase [Brevibacterium sp. JNUCC-42]